MTATTTKARHINIHQNDFVLFFKINSLRPFFGRVNHIVYKIYNHAARFLNKKLRFLSFIPRTAFFIASFYHILDAFSSVSYGILQTFNKLSPFIHKTEAKFVLFPVRKLFFGLKQAFNEELNTDCQQHDTAK